MTVPRACDTTALSEERALEHSWQTGRPMAVLRDGVGRSVDDEVFRAREGRSFPVEYICTPIKDEERIVGAVVTFRDITERKRVETQLQYLADHDPLTGLFNRRRFEEELERQVAFA